MHLITAEKRETRQWVLFENRGETLFGVLHRPQLFQSNKERITPSPVVIILHGFKSHKIGTNRSYVRLAEELAKEGIATLRFDSRGCGDSQGDATEITFEGLVSDAIAALSYLLKDPLLDSSRIACMGSSLGGSVAVYAGAAMNILKTLVLWAPVASGALWYRDFLLRHPEMAHQDPSEALSTYQGGLVNPLFREQFAVMNAAEKISQLNTTPLLHLQGEVDSVVSLLHQQAYKEGRAHATVPSHFITLEETEHYLGGTAAFPRVLYETVQWFKKYL